MQRRATPALVTACAALVALAGCGGGGGGAHGGSGGGGLTGLGGFGGLGLVDGGRPSDGGGSTGTDAPLTPAPPICGNGIVETGEACDVAAGCPAGQRCGATCACVAGPAPSMDSGALIAAALAAGRIDYFTSLLYRAFRFAGDGRLPYEYLGDLTVDEDPSLFLEISRLWATLTPAQQAQLKPYVVRPTDPASVFSTAPTAAFSGESGDDLSLACQPDGVQCPIDPTTHAGDWRWTESTHFVVWSCGSGDRTTDPYAGKRAAAAAIAEQVWALETPSMGTPRPDDFVLGPGDNTRTDIYLLPLNKCICRGPDTVCSALVGNKIIAGAAPDSPCDASRGPLTSSGFILLRLDLTPDSAPAAGDVIKARSDFAHEFFHLLTYGLNLEAQGGVCVGTKSRNLIGDTSWLTEASGTWAEWAYTPTDDPQYRTDQFTKYQARVPYIASLLDNQPGRADNDAYQAFVYPLFLSQEAGSRAPFEAFWKGATAPRTPEALDDLLDTRLPFDPHFRDFAVRLLNKTLPGDPLAPLLSAFDKPVTPEVLPFLVDDMELPPLMTDFSFYVKLKPLSAQYEHMNISDITRWVDIDLSGAGADLTLDAIVKVKDKWERRRPNGLRFTFCRDDAADDISEMYVIVANTAHTRDAEVDGEYKIKTRVACPASLTGWIRSERVVTSNYQLDGDTTADYERTNETWTLGDESMVVTGPVSFPGVDVYWSGQYELHDSTVTAVTGACQGQPVLQTTDASGSGNHRSQLGITEAPNGLLYLSATGAPLGAFNAPRNWYDQTCDGLSQSGSGDNVINESLAQVSTFLQLMPDMDDPTHYHGSVVAAHQETPRTGGMDAVDWTITWDINRNRKP